MKYKIKAFGITRDILGNREIVFEVHKGERVSDLVEALNAAYPDLKPLNLFIAVNNEYAEGERSLREQDEIALIPPVSGG